MNRTERIRTSYIYKRVAALRKHSGITQKELAKLLDVSERTLSRWETGRSSSRNGCRIISMLSDIFGVSTDYIFGISDLDIANVPNIHNYYNVYLTDKPLYRTILDLSIENLIIQAEKKSQNVKKAS